MKQRDLFYLQKIADDVRGVNESLNYIHIQADGDFLIAEASDGLSYSRILEPSRIHAQGCYLFNAKSRDYTVDFEDDRIINSQGETLATLKASKFPIISQGKKGNYRAVFNVKDLCHPLKYTLTTFKSNEKLLFWFKMTRLKSYWVAVGYKENRPLYTCKIPLNIADSVTEGLSFIVNAYSLRTILRWHEDGDLDFYFKDITGKAKDNIFILNPSKNDRLSILRPFGGGR